MSVTDPPSGFVWSTMVPELLVSDLEVSLHFWCGLCGFTVAYERPEDRFAYLDHTGRQIMLEEAAAPGRRWITGPLERKRLGEALAYVQAQQAAYPAHQRRGAPERDRAVNNLEAPGRPSGRGRSAISTLQPQ